MVYITWLSWLLFKSSISAYFWLSDSTSSKNPSIFQVPIPLHTMIRQNIWLCTCDRMAGCFDTNGLCWWCLRECYVTSVVSDFSWPHGLMPSRLLCPWDSPGKNTGVSCHALLQGIFLTQGFNPHLLHLLHWQVGSLTRVIWEALCWWYLWLNTFYIQRAYIHQKHNCMEMLKQICSQYVSIQKWHH